MPWRRGACTEYQSSAPYDFDLETAWSAPVSDTIGRVVAGVDSEHCIQYGGHVMKPTFTWMMSVGGLLMLAGPVLGMVVTVMGMTRSFEVLGANGVGDPGQLSAAIGETLVSTAVGIVFGFAGFALFLSGLIGWCVERKRLKSQTAAGVTDS